MNRSFVSNLWFKILNADKTELGNGVNHDLEHKIMHFLSATFHSNVKIKRLNIRLCVDSEVQ